MTIFGLSLSSSAWQPVGLRFVPGCRGRICRRQVVGGLSLAENDPVTRAVFQGDFWPPVSAAENSVPGGRVSTADTVGQPGNIGNLWAKNAVSNSVHILRIKSEGLELPAPIRRHCTQVRLSFLKRSGSSISPLAP
jgi:hypothetical protein